MGDGFGLGGDVTAIDHDFDDELVTIGRGQISPLVDRALTVDDNLLCMIAGVVLTPSFVARGGHLVLKFQISDLDKYRAAPFSDIIGHRVVLGIWPGTENTVTVEGYGAPARGTSSSPAFDEAQARVKDREYLRMIERSIDYIGANMDDDVDGDGDPRWNSDGTWHG